MTVYAAPGAAGAKIAYKARYDNFIGGRFVPPVKEQYFDVVTPSAARSTPAPRAPRPKTSNWRWMPPMPPATPGAAPARPSVRTSC